LHLVGPVYVDNALVPAEQTISAPGSYGVTTTVNRYPQYGVVQFEISDSQNADPTPPSNVLVRVVMQAGGMHPADVVADLVARAGGVVDPVAFAAAKAARPHDRIHCRFETQQGEVGQGGPGSPQDWTQQSVTYADALKAICRGCLYWFVEDHGLIRLFAYDGIPPSAPVLALADDLLYEAQPVTDMDKLKKYVTIKWGWYARNPNLFYVAGDTTRGDGEDMDLSWGASSGVAIESDVMAKNLADLYLKFLYAQERLEPVRLSWKGMRLELLDPVSVDDPILTDNPITYQVMRKEAALDAPRGTTLQLMRNLGEL
jgi:hypothetical protein